MRTRVWKLRGTGETPGELEVRGPWVASHYYESPDQAHRWTEDGWFKTGDVATVDEDGVVKIVDRAKDLVKSGGEWISSVDLENALMGHPAVKEACVVGIPHPKWQERPLAAIVLKDGKARDGRRAAELSGGDLCQVATAGRVCVFGRDSADECRQIQENCAARAVCGLEVGVGSDSQLRA